MEKPSREVLKPNPSPRQPLVSPQQPLQHFDAGPLTRQPLDFGGSSLPSGSPQPGAEPSGLPARTERDTDQKSGQFLSETSHDPDNNPRAQSPQASASTTLLAGAARRRLNRVWISTRLGPAAMFSFSQHSQCSAAGHSVGQSA